MQLLRSEKSGALKNVRAAMKKHPVMSRAFSRVALNSVRGAMNISPPREASRARRSEIDLHQVRRQRRASVMYTYPQ